MLNSFMMAWLHRPISGFLLDISGVLKNGDIPIEGSIEAIQNLNSLNIPYRLLTNETQLSKQLIFEQLTQMGFPIPSPELVLSPAPTLAKYLDKNGLRPYFLVHPSVLADFSKVDQRDPNCLVVGDALHDFTYENMNKSFQFLMKNSERKIFSMGKGKFYQEDGELKLDLGAFVTGLEYATDRKATIFGKPSTEFFDAALQDMGFSNENVIMIGDDICGDVEGAQQANIRGVLVKTGKYRDGDETKHGIYPDGVVENLKDAIDQYLKIA